METMYDSVALQIINEEVERDSRLDQAITYVLDAGNAKLDILRNQLLALGVDTAA